MDIEFKKIGINFWQQEKDITPIHNVYSIFTLFHSTDWKSMEKEQSELRITAGLQKQTFNIFMWWNLTYIYSVVFIF